MSSHQDSASSFRAPSPSLSNTSADTGREIYRTSLSSLKDAVLDITSSATPRRYRLFDCAQFINHQCLIIHEFTDISRVKYAAISYVWRGDPIDPASLETMGSDTLGTFAVKGAEDGDPISIDVLCQVCTAALLLAVPYLWLDRVCIMQTSRADKSWQITRMHGVYKGCDVCFVLPGGIRHLASVQVKTAWIHRAWTLQEVMAPERVMVIFAWAHGAVEGTGWKEITPPLKCCMCSVKELFQRSIIPVEVTTGDGRKIKAKTDILGDGVHLGSLLGAMAEDNPETKAQAIWRSAMMRTSSRPVDMVFSIMGLFGVALDPELFDKDDRAGATIALARKILENGGSPSWLGSSFHLPPAPGLSAFPIFPRTSVSGRAFFDIDGAQRPVEELVQARMEWLDGLPNGAMNAAGVFSFEARAVHLLPTSDHSSNASQASRGLMIEQGHERAPTHITAMDGSVWQMDLDGEDNSPHQHYAIFLGKMKKYLFGALPDYYDPNSMRALLVEHCGLGKVHRKSYFAFGDSYQPLVDGWHRYQFSIGGPDSHGDERPATPQDHPVRVRSAHDANNPEPAFAGYRPTYIPWCEAHVAVADE